MTHCFPFFRCATFVSYLLDYVLSMRSYTMAPEVLKGKYTTSADLWSTGVIAYMLLSSQMPFFGRTRQHIVEQIIKGTYEFKGRRWKKLSEQSKAFVQDLLVVDPHDRLTADDALSAPWSNRRFSASVRNPQAEEIETAQQCLLKFAGYSKLKRVALMVIAHKSTVTEIGFLRKIQNETASLALRNSRLPSPSPESVKANIKRYLMQW
jgi:calcium-dependent protein kinase